jgi:hypothetical protein
MFDVVINYIIKYLETNDINEVYKAYIYKI